MKRLLPIAPIVWVLIAAASTSSQPQYGWTVSSSTTDPCVNSGSFPAGLVELHLWYAYNAKEGFYGADISPVVSPLDALDILDFTPLSGFLNAGTPTHLLLVISGCRHAPILAGTWSGIASVPQWELCLGGENWSGDCSLPTIYPNETRGFGNNTAPTCLPGIEELCPPEVSVESARWGSIKAMYR